MTNDRRTTIFGDQIEDRTITPDELDTINSEFDSGILAYSGSKMKWINGCCTWVGAPRRTIST